MHITPNTVVITLPTSKSLVNRLLVIHALMNNWDALQPLDNGNDDVSTMYNALIQLNTTNNCTLNIGHGGTCMRFLTAYIALQTNKTVLLTGSQRMQQRTIKPLVDALAQLGATIEYCNKIGFPPLKIMGSTLNFSNTIVIDASVSSQYITALLLIAPYINNGLQLRLMGNVVSKPYIQQTISVMQHFGAEVDMNNKNIIVKPSVYSVPSSSITIERDWSSAAFWYNYVAISPSSTPLLLSNLQLNTTQGDEACCSIYAQLGVQSEVVSEGIIISKIKNFVTPNNLSFDLTLTPDLTQPLAVSLAMLGIKATLTGLQTLTIKETNRIQALINELHRFNVNCTSNGIDNLIIESLTPVYNNTTIVTYNDHRMAMSFAPCVQLFKNIIIDDETVVSKSYKQFWDMMRLLN
jgi:3-phosphoshikimate 1-carboxyvinyltransferase